MLVQHLLAEVEDRWTVDWAPTYQAGLDGLAERRHDAALLDYQLGANTGMDLLRRVQAIADRPPIILLTGRGGRAVDLAAMATGAADYLDKAGLSGHLLERSLRNAIERRRAVVEHVRLVAAIEQTAESIIVTDAARVITYANPAYERSSGNDAADVIGRDARLVLGGTDSASASPRIARRLQSGQTWTGTQEMRRRDGSIYVEDVTIYPVRDRSGTVVSFVRVARDVTKIREIQASLELSTRERVAFARALARLQQRATPEETAQDITDAITELPGIDFAALLSFEGSDQGRVLGSTSPGDHQFAVGSVIPAGRSAGMRERALHGAWTERWIQGGDQGDAYVATLDAMGVRAVASAPVGDVEPIGMVVLGTTDEAVARAIDSHLPAAMEFAAAAASLIAGALASRSAMRASRSRIEEIIETGAFDPVFQPIVDLATGVAVGFEALTRFRDGTRPDLVFAEAVEAGVGLELEGATLERVIAASRRLPAGAWLGLNVSGALIIERDRLVRVLDGRTCPIVLEITEHDVITEYATVRATAAALGPDVRIAVDDAGAGAANFNHIVELRPDFVKIDIGLVRGVDHDLTRQALVVGLRHFALATDGWVVAEGVETAEERDALIALDIELGQGFLFGRPTDIDTLLAGHPTRSSARP
jgi:PAS domain S-box-containing protein